MAIRATIEAPPVAAPPIGLLRSAVVVEDGQTARWVASGLDYEAEGCADLGVADPCTPGSGWELSADVDTDQVGADAFVVWAADRCSMMDNRRDGEARARRRLAAWQEYGVSREFWSGEQHRASGWTGKYLADEVADGTEHIGAGTPVAVRDALAALEEYLASHTPQGMIHAHPNLVTLWDGMNLLRREGARLFTIQDTIVVPGRGYTGAAPTADGTADPEVDATGATAYAYATSIVHVRLGAVTVTESVDRSVNTRVLRAARPAIAMWDPCAHAAINVDMADRS